MDFLDPLKRRRHRRRLIASYIFITMLLIAGTIVLVLITYGYGINTKTGAIVQNGLLFVQSKPSADITLNGAHRGSTSARLVLPTDEYSLTLSRSGYLDWQRSFFIKEQTVLRLEYPILIPAKPTIEPVKQYASLPSLVSASLDRHWLLVGGSVDAKGRASLDLYDTNHPDQNPQSVALIRGILSPPGDQTGQLNVVQWSSDNKHVLLEHKFGSGHEFIWFDRTAPNNSINLNRQFAVTPDSVKLPPKANQFFIYTAKHGNLQLATPTDQSLSKPAVSGVVDYQPLDTNLAVYSQSQPKQGTTINIWQSGTSYQMAALPAAAHVLLAGSNYQGHWYYALANPQGPWLSVYQDPLTDLTKPSPGKLDALVSIKLEHPSHLSVSPNGRFIEVDNSQQLATIDLNTTYHYAYKLALDANTLPLWTDSFHFSTASGGRLQLIDYDGANRYSLSPSGFSGGGFLSADEHQLWSFGAVDSAGRLDLQATHLIANQ